LLVETPYTTFKKLFQKDNSVEKENYVLLSSVSRSKNIRIRIQYLRFFEEFVKHIAQRRDGILAVMQPTSTIVISIDSIPTL
jgi:hypothetical protein